MTTILVKSTFVRTTNELGRADGYDTNHVTGPGTVIGELTLGDGFEIRTVDGCDMIYHPELVGIGHGIRGMESVWHVRPIRDGVNGHIAGVTFKAL